MGRLAIMPEQVAFIGREKEIAQYEQWLASSDGPWILYFHDTFVEEEKRGGIGKTWLLRKCMEVTKRRYPKKPIVTVDFFNVMDRSGIVIAERVVEQVKAVNPEWSPAASEALLAEYREGRKAAIDDALLERRLANALAHDLSSLDKELQGAGRSLLLFYDTFELIEKDPIAVLLNPIAQFPENYQFAHIGVVMAGRNPLPLNNPSFYWCVHPQEVSEIPLNPFDAEKMVEYINSDVNSVIATQVADSPDMKKLYDLTEGRPILIGLVMDVVNKQVLTLDDLLRVSPSAFERYIVSHISSLQEPISWIILFMAHAYHRFNESILDWMLQQSYLYENIQNINHQDLLRELSTLSFVRHSLTGNDFVLHDEMRRLVNRYCWERQDPEKQSRIEISNFMIKYYDEELRKEPNELVNQSCNVEILYHKLFVDSELGMKFLEEIFPNALATWSLSYAWSLLQEAQKFTLSREQHYRLLLLEARLLRREEKPRDAQVLYEYLQAEARQDWLAQHRSSIYSGLADCFLSVGNYPRAHENASKSLEIEQSAGNKPREAELLEMLGYIYKCWGEFSDAITYYDRALVIYKQIGNRREYADKVNSLGNLYRVLGRMEEALRYCLVALQIREDLLVQGKVGEVQKGLSLATIGVIYLESNDISQADKYFQEAFIIFKSSDYKKGIARTYNRFGQIKEARGDLDGAMEDFNLAYELAVSIEAQEEQISSINKQGGVFMRQRQLDSAKICFEKAIDLSKQKHDDFQEVEALIGLAGVFKEFNMCDTAQKYLKDGMRIADEKGYFNILGKAENYLGMISYQQEDYNTAFDYFIKSCHHMALFNPLRYYEAIRSLTEHLLQLPEKSWPAILAMIRTYWSDRKLGRRYPELIRLCEDVKKLGSKKII